MTEHPLVSICIPAYNAASTVRETLASILAQTYPNLVVHVSDNASTDDTIKVIESMADPRIVIHRNEVNVGGVENINRCIRLANGRYTAIFHADDIYEPEMVERQVAFLEAHPGAGAVFTEAKLIDEHGAIFGQIGFPEGMGSFDQLYDFETVFKAVLKYSNFLICPSVMARTEVYQQEIKKWHGDKFHSSVDLDAWLRIAQQHKIGLLPQPLMRYRISASQFSAKLRARTTRADFFLVMDHYLALEQVKSLLAPSDLLNFNRLERTDQVVRAMNLYILGQDREAKELCSGALSADAFRAAFTGRRNLITLGLAIFVYMLLLFRVPQIGRPLMMKLKRIARK